MEDDLLKYLYGHVEKDAPTPNDCWNYLQLLLALRIHRKWHNVVVVSGESGVGKSTLALRAARDVQAATRLIAELAPETYAQICDRQIPAEDLLPDLVKSLDWTAAFRDAQERPDRFDPATQVAYDAKDMLNLYESRSFGDAVVSDEAIEGGYNRQWQSVENIELVKAVNKVRAKGITVFYLIPHLEDLDPEFRERSCRFWIYCEAERSGRAIAHERPSKIRYLRRQPRSFGFYQLRRYARLEFEPLDGTEFWSTYQAAKMDRIQRSLHDAKRRLELSDPLVKAKEREERAQQREEKARKFIELRNQGYPQDRARAIAHIGWEDARAVDPRKKKTKNSA